MLLILNTPSANGQGRVALDASSTRHRSTTSIHPAGFPTADLRTPLLTEGRLPPRQPECWRTACLQSVFVRWILLVLSVALVLSCHAHASVPDHCDSPLNSNMAYGAWVNAWDRQDRDELNRSAACMVQGCKAGEENSCSDLSQLCSHPIRSLDESLTKTAACELQGVSTPK